MSEQLDNELRKRINEVFENYEDTAPAEEGWALLRQKFPEKKKNRVIPMWWMATAAMLLVLTMFGLWFYNTPTKTAQQKDQVVVKSQKQNAQPADDQPQTFKPNKTLIDTSYNNIKSSDLQLSKQFKIKQNYKNSFVLKKSDDQNSSNPDVITNQGNYIASLPAVKPSVNSPVQNTGVLTTGNDVAQPNTAAGSTDTANRTSQVILAQQKPVEAAQQKSIIALPKDSASADVSQSRMAKFLVSEQKKEDAKAKKDKTENKLDADKKVLFGVYAATYFNYAEGSKSQVNNGAGLSTDIRLSKNFKLSTGVSIGRNTLSYDNQHQVSARVQNDAVAASNYATVEILPASTNNQLGYTPLKVATSPTVSAYNVSLTGLDVPINIKYEFNPQKTDAYISAGLSSGTFISENFSYRFDNNITNGLATSNTAAVPDASTSRSFTGFNFARTLNLSMGMGYQITPHNRLVIEPFFKYPLGGMGSQQIRFGSGGVNLQFKFQSKKK